MHFRTPVNNSIDSIAPRKMYNHTHKHRLYAKININIIVMRMERH